MRLKKWQVVTLIALAVLCFIVLGIFAIVVMPNTGVTPVPVAVIQTQTAPLPTLTATPSQSPSHTPKPTDTPTPSDTPTPANSPTITLTPTETPTPTKTKIPTRTPRPTPAATSTISLEAQLEARLAYLRAMLDLLNRIDSSESDFSGLMQQWHLDNRIYTNTTWQGQLAAVFVTWKQIRSDVRRISAPPYYKEHYRLFSSGCDHLVMAAEHYTAVLSNIDQAELDLANAEYKLANLLFEEASLTSDR